MTRTRNNQAQVSYLSPVIAPCRSKCYAQSPADGQVWPGDMGCRICLFYKHFVIQQAPRLGKKAQRRHRAAQGLHRAVGDCREARGNNTRPWASSRAGMMVGAVRVTPAVTTLTVYRRPRVMTRRAPLLPYEKLSS